MIVNANGGTVFCEVVGSGPPLLIPGYASTPLFFARAKPFTEHFTVIGCDVRGEAAKTEFPPGPYTMADLADDTADALTELGFEKFHYLGTSHTGMLGQELALRHPDRIDRLVLSNTGPGLDRSISGDHELPVREGEYTDAVKAAEIGPEGIRQLSEMTFSAAAIAQNPSLADDTAKYGFGPIFAMPKEEQSWSWAAYGQWSIRDRLSEIQHQTLIITSDGDRIGTSEDHWLMWRKIPRAVLIALNGIGHDWFAEAPEVGARVVRMFLRGELDPTYT